MKKLLFLVMAMFFVMTMGVATAMATALDTSAPFEIGSWGVRFQEDGVYNGTHHDFNKIEVFGSVFEDPGMANFSVAGWTGTMINDQYVLSVGSSVGYIQWDFHFEGSQSQPFDFDYLVWNGATLLGITHINWTGSGWTFGAIMGDGSGYDRSAPVPEPATMLLLGSGLVGLAGWGRKDILRKLKLRR